MMEGKQRVSQVIDKYDVNRFMVLYNIVRWFFSEPLAKQILKDLDNAEKLRDAYENGRKNHEGKIK